MSWSQTKCFCSVPGCSCGAQKQPYLSFHGFPTDPEQRKQWTRAIRREEGPHFCIKRGSTYVCSRHFTADDYMSGSASRLRSGVVPSLFLWNNFTKLPTRENVLKSAGTRTLCDVTNKDHDYAAHPPAGALDKALDYIKQLEAKLEKVALSPALFKRFCASDDQIQFYTKFPSERVFRIFWETIAPSASHLACWTRAQKIGGETCPEEPNPSRNTPLIDEFLMYSFRIAAGMKEQLISDMFNVSVATVNRVTVTWANYLFVVLSSVNLWMCRDVVKASAPQRFQRLYPNVRVILDCTEIILETSSSVTSRSEPLLTYKNHATLKGLMGIAPCGLVTFISSLHTVSISGEDITRISGILPLLEAGDEVMADLRIRDLLDEVGAKLVVPPLRPQGPLSQEETEKSQASALFWIIVERVMARVKSFHIWDSPVPLTLRGSVNQIWHYCCVMANYQGPFCLEE